eukprot:scaffold82047_cov31-Tisochrysis_lutea.AAC.8
MVGNYKGVMLCTRPANSAPSAGGIGPIHLSPTLDAPQFRPVGLPAEPIGLNPAKDNCATNVAKAHEEAARRRAAAPKLGQENFLTKHRRWLSEMAKAKAELNDELETAAQAAMDKRKRFSEYCKATRKSGIRLVPGVNSSATPLPDSMAETTGETLPPRPAATMQDDEPAKATSGPVETPTPAAKAVTKGKGSSKPKPKWAMTEEEADDFEDAEADALVDFASGLDYESFIDDLEVRQALSVIKERIDAQKALVQAAARAEEISEEEARTAMAETTELEGDDWKASFLSKWNAVDGDDDAGSIRSGRSRASRLASNNVVGETQQQPDWDSSTNAGDRVSHGPSTSAVEMAKALLESNPSLAAKHSVRSLAAAVQTATGKDDTAGPGTSRTLRDMMASDPPPLKLVTINEKPEAVKKTVDASNLPYLHRNPAV